MGRIIESQVKGILSAIIGKCKCKVSINIEFSKLNMVEGNMILFKKLLNRQYGIEFTDIEIRNQKTVKGLSDYIHDKLAEAI